MNVDHLFDALLDVEGTWLTEDTDRDEVVGLWYDLEHLHQILGSLLRTIGEDASSRLLDRDDPTAPYVLPRGDVVFLNQPPAPEAYYGRAIATALAAPVRTVDGEVVDAVPLAVLLDVLPAVADDEARPSSKWRTTGLRRHLPDWTRYRVREEPPPPRISKRPNRG